LTVTHYTGLNSLIATYAARGFAILGTPCAQFANQEAAANAEILNVLQFVRPGKGFIPAFPLTQKLLVNGVGADPLWVYARSSCPAPVLEIADNLPLWLPITSSDVSWNFEAVLFRKTGEPYKRFGPSVDPLLYAPDIEALLAE